MPLLGNLKLSPLRLSFSVPGDFRGFANELLKQERGRQNKKGPGSRQVPFLKSNQVTV